MPKTRGSWKAEISNWDGIRLKQVRVMQGNISQEDFAKLANVTKFHVSDIESGRIKPSSNVIAAVAKLGYDINWFLNGISSKDETININVPIFSVMSNMKLLNFQQATFISNFVDEYVKSLNIEKTSEKTVKSNRGNRSTK